MNFSGKTVKKLVASVIATAVTLAALPTMAVEYIGIGTVSANGVNIRSDASLAAHVIGNAGNGEKYPALENVDGWVKISYNDKTAWICGTYISVAPISLENSNGYVKGDVVNIRKEPSTQSEILTTVAFGTKLVVYGKEDGWHKVSANGCTGYISDDYFTTEAIITSVATSTGNAVADEALKHVGKSYVYGASGPNAFDCSGFALYVYKQFGYSLNRVAADQMSNGVPVEKSELLPGDLVFFTSGRGSSYVSHVGIYIGNNQMVHASTSTTGVIISGLDSGYYTQRYAGARRIVK